MCAGLENNFLKIPNVKSGILEDEGTVWVSYNGLTKGDDFYHEIDYKFCPFCGEPISGIIERLNSNEPENILFKNGQSLNSFYYNVYEFEGEEIKALNKRRAYDILRSKGVLTKENYNNLVPLRKERNGEVIEYFKPDQKMVFTEKEKQAALDYMQKITKEEKPYNVYIESGYVIKATDKYKAVELFKILYDLPVSRKKLKAVRKEKYGQVLVKY